LEQDDYLNQDGTQPFDLFNNEFIENPPKDEPFDFSERGPGVGWSPYDPNDYLPIDYQHYVRRTKANKALIWLDNDPLARRYLMMDAELGRMCFYEGPEGRLKLPITPGMGTSMGRAEAWVGDAMATAYAIAPASWRSSRMAWFERFVDALRSAQMPMGLFSALNFGKTATSPPYGNGHDAFYWVHRSNEQIFLMHTMRGIQETVGIHCGDLLASCGQALWDFCWKDGFDGPLESWPAGPVGGPRYSNKSQIPTGLTDSIFKDNWHIANALAVAQLEGASVVPALLSYTRMSNLQDAKTQFLNWGKANIANRAMALSLLQELVP